MQLAGLALACCLAGCAFKTPTSDTTRASGPAPFLIDDRVTGTTANRFTYVGRWEHVHGDRDGRYDATSTRCFTPGDSVSLFFYGRRVELHGVNGPNGGPATLVIDGKLHAIDFFNRTKTMATVYLSPAMRPGPHTLVVVVGVKPKGIAPRGFVNIDYARVEP